MRRERSAPTSDEARLTDPSGITRTRYFVLNASLGVVAQGNAFFNAPDQTLRALKKTSVDLAIAYAAVVSIARFTPVTLNLSLDDQPSGGCRSPHSASSRRSTSPAACATTRR